MSYFEAVNKETLKNSYQRFEEEGILQVVKSKDPKVPPRLRLNPDWKPSRDPTTGELVADGRLWEFTEKIASSRREGKNRRDGATVSTRVLRLTDHLGGQLFEAAKGQEGASRLSKEDSKIFIKGLKDRKKRKSFDGRAHL